MSTVRNTVITCDHILCMEKIKVYATIKALCKDKKWSKHTLYRKKMPFEYKGYLINRKQIIR